MDSIKRLERQLDYRFQDKSLLQRALKHRSAGRNHNERLEFLGDAILGSVMACYLYDTFQDSCEGALSRLRSQLVMKDTLAELAQGLNLSDVVMLGEGELKSGGFRRASILADSLEALFGAIYLDAGYAEIRRVILMLYQSKLASLDANLIVKDPKTQLQEYLQARGEALPAYEVLKIEGVQHQQTFFVACRVAGYDFVSKGDGPSRRRAEQKAAALWLDWINQSLKEE